MKTRLFCFLLIVLLLVVACGGSQFQEQQQQEQNQLSLIQNQPVPNLGGYSFERDVVIQTYLARNRTIATYTYTMTEFDGKIIEICASIGYPIPYATQLTNPLRSTTNGATIGNPEPNGYIHLIQQREQLSIAPMGMVRLHQPTGSLVYLLCHIGLNPICN